MSHEIDTPHGPARIHVHRAERPVGILALGHGAGGGVGARDLLVAVETGLALGFTGVLVEQPYRVAGRRSPAPAAQLDAAWLAVIEHLRAHAGNQLPLVTGGRSSGARVACRTAAATGSAGVLCLAFPLQPPARKSGAQSPSRLPELEGVPCPVLIVQGENDPFGMPEPAPGREVARVGGDHSLRSDLPKVGALIGEWLGRFAGTQPS